jgi:hypothetical protein
MLALLTVLAVPALVSCAGSGSGDGTTAGPAAGSDTAPGPDESTAYQFKQKDYGGESFTVWQRDHDATSYKAEYIINYEEGTDIMSQAVTRRNSMVENYYNIKFALREGLTVSKLQTELLGGDLDADLVYGQRNSLATIITAGHLQAFNDLEIDYSNPWWHEKTFEDLRFGGKNYLAQNDISIYRFCGARFFYWNKRLQTERGLDNPYQLMKENKWDFEHFLTMVKGVSTDNGFTALGEYGLLLEVGAANGVFAHLAAGFGIPLTKYNADGELEVALLDNMEKIDTCFNKMKTAFSDMYSVLDFSMAQMLDTKQEGAGTAHVFNWGRKLFANGHFLFTQTNIVCSVQFIEMVDEYGVAPNPKYNSDQEEYIHKDDGNSLIFAIPNSPNIDRSRLANVMDYWAYVSTDTVMTDYYEITIKTKRAYEPEAGQVIDIVKETTRSEIAEVLSLGVAPVLNDAYGKGSISSAWDAKKSEINEKIKEFNAWEPD